MRADHKHFFQKLFKPSQVASLDIYIDSEDIYEVFLEVEKETGLKASFLFEYTGLDPFAFGSFQGEPLTRVQGFKKALSNIDDEYLILWFGEYEVFGTMDLIFPMKDLDIELDHWSNLEILKALDPDFSLNHKWARVAESTNCLDSTDDLFEFLLNEDDLEDCCQDFLEKRYLSTFDPMIAFYQTVDQINSKWKSLLEKLGLS